MCISLEGSSIGALLCESRSGKIVGYALENTHQPIGVASYHVTRDLPSNIRDKVPSIGHLEEVVSKLRVEPETDE